MNGTGRNCLVKQYDVHGCVKSNNSVFMKRIIPSEETKTEKPEAVPKKRIDLELRKGSLGVRVPNAMAHWALTQPTLQQKPSQHFPLGKLVDQATHFSATLAPTPFDSNSA